jgi:hypothetical protein
MLLLKVLSMPGIKSRKSFGASENSSGSNLSETTFPILPSTIKSPEEPNTSPFLFSSSCGVVTSTAFTKPEPTVSV